MKNEKRSSKRILYTAAAMLSALSVVLTGCGSAEKKDESSRISVVTTIFPIYDWTKALAENTSLENSITFLMDQGVDMHSYLPTAKDMAVITNADLVVFVGGESEEWMRDLLEANPNPARHELALMDVLNDRVLEEELVEGMEGENDAGSVTEDEEESEYDEHIWLSLKNAEICCKAIADSLTDVLGNAALDNAEAGRIADNLTAYLEKLDSLDTEYKESIEECPGKTLLFGDRFPFRYLTEDYNLEYFAAFSGCYADAEASFATVTFLAGKLDELGMDCVLTIDGSDRKLAETIIDNSKDKSWEILTLDSMQSVTGDRAESGDSYISVMENNLAVIVRALGGADGIH